MRRLGTTAMEARYLPDAYYARMGDEFAERVGGRHWIKYVYEDLEDLGGGAGAGFADQMRNTTPNQAVKLLLTAEDVRKVGEETTRGRRTTHWAGTMGGATAQTVDIWVDDRDLLVKKVERGRTETGELTQTAYYSDYGVRVSAERPPAADTADFKELLASQEAEARPAEKSQDRSNRFGYARVLVTNECCGATVRLLCPSRLHAPVSP